MHLVLYGLNEKRLSQRAYSKFGYQYLVHQWLFWLTMVANLTMENFNINTKTTAAESPWSNGLIERHNSVLGNIVSKMMSEEQGYSLNTAVAWAVSAKNSLKNVYGFSSNQLVFRKNLNFPCVMNNKLPALEGVTSSKIVTENLNVMHNARQAFIKTEADEKLR